MSVVRGPFRRAFEPTRRELLAQHRTAHGAARGIIGDAARVSRVGSCAARRARRLAHAAIRSREHPFRRGSSTRRRQLRPRHRCASAERRLSGCGGCDCPQSTSCALFGLFAEPGASASIYPPPRASVRHPRCARGLPYPILYASVPPAPPPASHVPPARRLGPPARRLEPPARRLEPPAREVARRRRRSRREPAPPLGITQKAGLPPVV